MSNRRMICPKCGAELNQHATKIDYDVDDPALIDPVFDGAIKEVHTCPKCGRTELRAAE